MSSAPQRRQAGPPPRRRRAGRAGVLVVVVGALLYALLWTRVGSTKHNLDSAAQAELDAGPQTFPEWAEDAASGTQYLQFLTCMGLCNQIEAFMDGVAIAYSLNLTVVLPRFYRHYDYFEPEGRIDRSTASFDPQIKYAVDMDYFFDVGALKQALAGMVTFVDELPPYLSSSLPGPYALLVGLDPNRKLSMRGYRDQLRLTRVLRLRCPLMSVMWSSEELGTLRRLLLANLTPSPRVTQPFSQRQKSIAATLQLTQPAPQWQGGAAEAGTAVAARRLLAGSAPAVQYLGLHLRNEDDWWDYCQREAQNPEATWVDSRKLCYQGASDVARFLAKLHLPSRYPVVYVASGNFTERDAVELLDVGFQAAVSERLACHVDRLGQPSCGMLTSNMTDRELRAAVDLQMLIASDFFVGNAFSSFSGTVRLARLARRDPLAALADSVYYNLPLNATAADVAPLETHRFGLYPGMFDRTLYEQRAPGFAHLLAQQRQGKCLHKWSPAPEECFGSAQPPRVVGIRLNHAGRVDIDSVIDLGGWVNTSQPNWYPRLEVLLDDQPIGTLLANARGRTTPPHSNYFSGQVVYSLPPGKRSTWSNITVCSMEDDFMRVCSKPRRVDLRQQLNVHVSQPRDPIVYLFFPDHKLITGGPEALHQLHREINRWHVAGEIAVRSVFPKGNPFYRGPFSNLTNSTLDPADLTPQDYFLVPEKPPDMESWWPHVFFQTGTIPIVYFLGQHHHRLADTGSTRPFKPVCISYYFAHLYGCSKKGVLNTPMNASFVDAADVWQATHAPKEDIVVFDPDLTNHLDITKLKLPPGVRLKELARMTRQEVIDLYRRAKVLIDSYVTGMERAVFEGAVFNMVPLIAQHGNARHPLDFVLPDKWRWQVHDYRRLNRLIAAALANYPAAVADMAPLRQYVRDMPTVFSEQVRRYFQDDVHVMIPVLGPTTGEVLGQHSIAAMVALIMTMHHYPFSSQELVTYNPYYLEFDHANIFAELQEHNEAHGVTTAPVLAEFTRFGSMAAYLQEPQARHYRNYVLILPPGAMPVHSELASALFKEAHRDGLDAVFGPGGSLLVRRARYYPLIPRMLPLLPSRLRLEELATLLQGAGLRVSHMDTVPSRPQCRVALAPLMGDAPLPSGSCFCQALMSAIDGWHYNKYMHHLASWEDPVLQRVADLRARCG